MPATFIQGTKVRALKSALDLNGVATVDGAQIFPDKIVITDSNNNVITSGIAASALNSLTAGTTVNVNPNEIAFGNAASAVTSSPALTYTPSAGTFAISGNFQNVGTITIETVQAASVSFANNATTQILSVPTANFNSLQIEYSVTRGTNREVGMAYVVQSGASASVAVQQGAIGDCGLTFSSSVISGNLGVSGTLTNATSAATFSYLYKRWLG